MNGVARGWNSQNTVKFLHAHFYFPATRRSTLGQLTCFEGERGGATAKVFLLEVVQGVSVSTKEKSLAKK